MLLHRPSGCVGESQDQFTDAYYSILPIISDSYGQSNTDLFTPNADNQVDVQSKCIVLRELSSLLRLHTGSIAFVKLRALKPIIQFFPSDITLFVQTGDVNIGDLNTFCYVPLNQFYVFCSWPWIRKPQVELLDPGPLLLRYST